VDSRRRRTSLSTPRISPQRYLFGSISDVLYGQARRRRAWPLSRQGGVRSVHAPIRAIVARHADRLRTASSPGGPGRLIRALLHMPLTFFRNHIGRL